MSYFNVLDSSLPELWHTYYNKLPQNFLDIHYTYAYNMMYEENGDGKVKLFIFEEGQHFFFYPFILRPIQNFDFATGFYDIETVYGYSGPLSNSLDTTFLKNARQTFRTWCKSVNVVSEFVRFNPMFHNEVFFNDMDDLSLVPLRQYVYVDLQQNEKELWNNSYTSVNRNRIRKALKHNLEIVRDVDCKYFDDFKHIYIESMLKHNASSLYFFSEPFYEALKKVLVKDGILILIKKDNEFIAGATFFKGNQVGHYFLSSANDIGKKYPSTNLLLHEAGLWARENGMKKLHLGGGMTSSEDDTLLRFKRRFSPYKETFYIGKAIHNEDMFKQLVQAWEAKYPKQVNRFKPILQRYRLTEQDFH